ncbi:MAG: hypothetical protein LBI95_00750 [Holosporales bacterium]|jgi:hypothetical protein|nr:hypothetical protein [Holosporales bacterium]
MKFGRFLLLPAILASAESSSSQLGGSEAEFEKRFESLSLFPSSLNEKYKMEKLEKEREKLNERIDVQIVQILTQQEEIEDLRKAVSFLTEVNKQQKGEEFHLLQFYKQNFGNKQWGKSSFFPTTPSDEEEKIAIQTLNEQVRILNEQVRIQNRRMKSLELDNKRLGKEVKNKNHEIQIKQKEIDDLRESLKLPDNRGAKAAVQKIFDESGKGMYTKVKSLKNEKVPLLTVLEIFNERNEMYREKILKHRCTIRELGKYREDSIRVSNLVFELRQEIELLRRQLVAKIEK